MRRSSKAIAAIISAAALAGTLGSTAYGQTATWTNSGSGDYSVGTNWSTTPSVPPVADSAAVSNGGTCIISAADSVSITQLWAGDSTTGGAGTISQTGGTVSASVFVAVGHAGKATGLYNLSGGTLNETGNAAGVDGIRIFGNSSAGATATVMLVSGTSVLTDPAEFSVGFNNGTNIGAGVLNISGGTITTSNTTGTTSNTSNAGGMFAVGNGVGTTGIVLMSAGTFNCGSQLWVGEGTSTTSAGGNGLFVLSGGTFNSSSWAVIGRGITSAVGDDTGVMNISGGTFSHTGGNGDFQVGSQGVAITATLNLTGGSLITDHISDQSTSGTQVINFNGGNLQTNGNDPNFIRTYASGDQVPTLNVRNGGAVLNTASYAIGIQLPLAHSVISGDSATDGGLTVNGTGTLTLTAADTYTGVTTVNGATLQITSDSGLGAVPSSAANNVFLNNGELFNNGAAMTTNANRTIVITGTSYLRPGPGGVAVNSAITGSGNLSVPFDSGTLVLNGADTYAGSTTIGSTGANSVSYNTSAGANLGLRLGNTAALPAGTALTFGVDPAYPSNTVTLDLNGFSPTVGTLNGGASAVIDNLTAGGSPNLTIGSAANAGSISTYAGAIQNTTGSLNLNKTGPGTQVFTGKLTYSGPTNVSGGKLYINGTSANSAFTAQSGSTLGGGGAVAGPVTINSGATLEAGYTGIGTFSTPGGLTLASGTTVSIGNITNYFAAGPAAVAAGALTFSGGTVAFSFSADGNLTSGSAYNLISYTSDSYTAPTTFAINSGSLPSRARATVTDVPAGTGTAGDIVLTITGTDFIKWTGATNGNWDTNPSDLNWALNSNGSPTYYIDNPGDNVVFDDTATGTTTISLGAATLHPNSVVFNNSALTYTLTGTGGIGGSTGLTMAGTGLTTLDTANSFTGPTVIQSGTLQLGTGGSLSAATTITLGSGSTSGTFVLGDSTGPVSTSIASLTTLGAGTANMVVGGNAAVSTLSVTGSLNDTYAGLLGNGISGASTANALALAKSGGGALYLTNANTYTGGTTINAGTININNASALGTGPLTFAGSGTLAAATNITLANNISTGTSTAAFDTGGNTLTLTGSVTSTGPTVGIPAIEPLGKGTLVLAGPLNVSGVINDSNNPAILMSVTGSTTTITGSGNLGGISVGWNGSTNTLNLQPAGTLTLTNNATALDVGQGAATAGGVVNQTAGTVVLNGQLSLGQFNNSWGNYVMTGGTLNASGGIFSGGNGNGNGSSYFLQSGGVANVSNFTTLGQGGSGTNVLLLTAGQYNNSNAATNFVIGGTTLGTGVATVTGGSLLVAGNITLGKGGIGTTSILNLNGGTTTTTAVQPKSVTADMIVNFNGGTLTAGPGAAVNFMSGLTVADICAGGAVINTAGQNVTIGQDLQSAGGLGGLNSAVSLASGGAGYVGAPVVNITGGGGFGASAVAAINPSTGQVTGITITSPGVGYTSNPVFTLTGGGGGGASVAAFTPTPNAADGGLTKLGSGTLTLSGYASYTGPTSVSGGALVIAADGSLPGGTIVGVATGATLVLPDQSTAASIGSLNVNGNVIVHGGSLAAVTAAVAQADNFGNWNGPGAITSTAAAGDSNHLTALGVILNDNGAGTATPVYTAFAGQPVSDSDVLIKYTYYGDANLDGEVDGSDYSLIDNGYANHLSGWYNGDFNYDGIVDGSDYALIDNAFNNQGAALTSALVAAETSQTAAATPAAVPEPQSPALVGIAIAGSFRRRRTRKAGDTECGDGRVAPTPSP